MDKTLTSLRMVEMVGVTVAVDVGGKIDRETLPMNQKRS